MHTTVLWVVGGITFGLTISAAISAFSAKGSFMFHLNDCGEDGTKPVSKEEYAKARLVSAGV